MASNEIKVTFNCFWSKEESNYQKCQQCEQPITGKYLYRLIILQVEMLNITESKMILCPDCFSHVDSEH